MQNYRKNVSIILVKEGKFLIGHRVGWNENWFEFLQGGVEEGETEEAAVLREINEELKLNKEDVEILGKSKETWKYDWPEELQKKKGFKGQVQSFFFVKYKKGKLINNPEEYDKILWADENQVLSHNGFKDKDVLKKNLILEFNKIFKP